MSEELNKDKIKYLEKVAQIEESELGEYLRHLLDLYYDSLVDSYLKKRLIEVLEEQYFHISRNFEIVKEEHTRTIVSETLEPK